jgi:DnaJ-class molecular chaperone
MTKIPFKRWRKKMFETDEVKFTIKGKEYSIKIPQACQPETKFGLQGQGLYQMNTNHRGDLIAIINIKTPVLTEQQLSILRNIRSTY